MAAPRRARPPPPPPPAGGRGGGGEGGGGRGAAAVEERRRRLREPLAAKGRAERPCAGSYLKDKPNRPDRLSSRSDPAVRCRISSISRKAPLQKAKRAAPADQVLGKRTSLPVSSKLPAKVHSKSSAGSPAKRHSCHPRKSEKRESDTRSLEVWSCRSKSHQEKVQCPNSGARAGLPLQQRGLSRRSHKATSQDSARQPLKRSRQTWGGLAGRCQARAEQRAASQAPCISVVRPPSQPGRSSVASRPVIQSQGQSPRVTKASEAADALARGSPSSAKENAAPSAPDLSRRERPKRQSKAWLALHDRACPVRSVGLRQKPRLPPGGGRSAAYGSVGGDRGSAEGDHRSEVPEQAAGTVALLSGHTGSSGCRASVAMGSPRCGGRTPKSRPLPAGAGQAPRTPCRQDRRHLLEQWLASRGKRYKRPPMTLPAQRRPKEKEDQKRSWNCPEEKRGEEREQLSLAAKITSILTECQKLAEEGFSSEALLAKLSCIPEVEKFAQFWVCKAQLLARRGGAFDAVGLYEAAVGAGAAPLQDLRTFIAGMLKDTSKAALATPGSKKSPRQATQGRAHKPRSTVKLQVLPLPRAKDPSVRPDTKLVTPVRRSLRIEGALGCYPPMLKDHDPVVSSLSAVLDSGAQFVFRSNTALPEEVDLAGLVAELHSLRDEATQHPKYAAVPQRGAAQHKAPSPLQTLSP